MRLRRMPLVFAIGAGAVAVAVAPITAAVDLGAHEVKPVSATVTEQDAGVPFVARPGAVAEPRGYGDFPSAASLPHWD